MLIVAIVPLDKSAIEKQMHNSVSGKRKYVKGLVCPCGVNLRRVGQRTCVACHNKYMREWRKTHTLTDEQRKKDNCRSYAGNYLKRGKLIRTPCEHCGEVKSQMHHPDYDRPLEVVWLCRPCHMELHKNMESHPHEQKAEPDYVK